MMTDIRRASFGGVTQVASVAAQDPWPLYPQVEQALAACSTYAQANAGTTGVADTVGGATWLNGFLGATLFNTIAPPDNPQYAWGSCEARQPEWIMGPRGICQCDQQPPGGCQLRLRRWQRSLPEEQYQPPNVLVAGYEGRRRSDQLGFLLTHEPGAAVRSGWDRADRIGPGRRQSRLCKRPGRTGCNRRLQPAIGSGGGDDPAPGSDGLSWFVNESPLQKKRWPH